MNLTQAVRKANLKKWKAQGPAIVQRPLRRIHEAHPDTKNAHGVAVSEDPIFTEARRAAARGDGGSVKLLAHQLLRA